jgi:hypothetical protein
MRLIGLDPYTSEHVVHAGRIGLGRMDADQISVDGPFAELTALVEPAVEDWAIKMMNRVARSEFLTRNFMLNDRVFYPLRTAVGVVRRMKKLVR